MKPEINRQRSFAEWRAVADRAFRWKNLGGIGLLLLVATVATIGLIHPSSGAARPVFQFSFSLITIFGIRAYMKSTSKSVLPPRDLPDPHEAIPVRMSVWLKETMVGNDVGWLSFSDGWLLFEGRGTHFTMKPSDVHGRVAGPYSWPCLRYLGPRGGARKVGFLALDSSPGSRNLGKRLDQWLRQGDPLGDSVLPPSSANVSKLRLGFSGIAAMLPILGSLFLFFYLIYAALARQTSVADSPFGVFLWLGLGGLGLSPIGYAIQSRETLRQLAADSAIRPLAEPAPERLSEEISSSSQLQEAGDPLNDVHQR